MRRHARRRRDRAGNRECIRAEIAGLRPSERAGRLAGSDNLPQSERAAREVLSLPIYPELDEPQLQEVISNVQAFQGAYHD